jgi:hypothetical protein
MPGVLKLLQGDLFDGPSDLIVIPCTTAGALTRHAEGLLAHYRIPRPPALLSLGDVVTLPFDGAENIAQYVAYAATAGAATPPANIEAIARRVGSETIHNKIVSRVAAPLIGIGGGERRAQVENALRATHLGFLATAAPRAVLTLRIADEHLFRAASRWFSERSRYERTSSDITDGAVASGCTPLRVFISYTKTSDEHTRWVESLATMLRANGIDARLDMWHLRHGMDVAQFMCNEIALAERVLIVSNDEYARRADGRLGGVGWETQLISGDLLTRTADDRKYLVVARTRDLRVGVPMFLKSKLVIQWPDDAADATCRELLLRELYGKLPSEPVLGPPPLFN